MKGWTGFLALCPERVRDVIENGPKPLADYAHTSFTGPDYAHGLARFKGDGGRGRTTSKKKGQPAVVYFNPQFVAEEYRGLDVPDEVLERHSEEARRAVYEEL